MQDFSALPATLADALSAKGYERLTQVQKAVSDPELAGLDLLVSAQTGSGKTVGFGLAMAGEILNDAGRFDPPSTPVALVIAPTRELALQVRREFDWLFANAGIVTASAVGGMDARTERRSIERGVHVIVATPGRLRDHIARGVIDLSDLAVVVLDEADEMLDMGFAEDLEFILDQTPDTRRTLLFSATVPKGIASLAQTYQNDNARRIAVGSKDDAHADISYQALTVASSEIEKSILNLLRFHEAETAIVFANTRAMVARLTAKLSNRGFSVVSLSGELSQTERTHALQALRDKRARVCIATDVAARGIDLPGLDLVIHADLPSNVESLLHRSGRTGRAGRKGTSVLIVPDRQRGKAQRLLKFGKLTAEWGTAPSAEDVLAQDEARILASPAWTTPADPEELAFAKRLMDTCSAEQIAVGYYRLFRDHHSAPELLSPPSEPGQRKKREPADFGPSVWFSLSLGRKDRAEPRWLLPMLCRNAGLSKDAIGAIRVQYQETFVEIATSAVPALRQELGPDLALEQGASLTELTGLPDFDASPKGPVDAPYPVAKPGGPKAAAHKKAPKKPRKPDVAQDAAPDISADAAPEPRKPKKPKHRDAPEPRSAETKARKPRDHGPKPAWGKDGPGPKKPRGSDGTAPKTPDGNSGTGPKKPRSKAAMDTSKSLRPGKSRHKAGGKGPAGPSKARRNKGGDARPFRKPSKGN